MPLMMSFRYSIGVNWTVRTPSTSDAPRAGIPSLMSWCMTFTEGMRPNYSRHAASIGSLTSISR